MNSADVVVVGSGVCGAMVAHEVAQAGLSVVILEAGPRGERSDYLQRFMSLPAGNRARGDVQSPSATSRSVYSKRPTWASRSPSCTGALTSIQAGGCKLGSGPLPAYSQLL